MTANLLLHHLSPEQLARLFEHVARSTPLFVACEPRRTRLALRASQLLWLIGCDDPSCHDAAASIWAGFKRKELSASWPQRHEWRLTERPVWPFLQFFVARRLVDRSRE